MRPLTVILLFFLLTAYSCGNQEQGFSAVNSESFPESAITLDQTIVARLQEQPLSTDSVQNPFAAPIDQVVNQLVKLKANPSDTLWNSIVEEWRKIGKAAFSDGSGYASLAFTEKWIELNSKLLKASEEVQFADELEKIVYQLPKPVVSEQQLKSVIYTHIDDQIFINFFGSSTLVHHHTTGGSVKLIQQTRFPESNEVTLTVEAGDVRFLSVFIHIPAWAQNPTVQHGNVKYVAHPGEYCEISRKWKTGDQIDIRLKN
jgi:hypothetical protein